MSVEHKTNNKIKLYFNSLSGYIWGVLYIFILIIIANKQIFLNSYLTTVKKNFYDHKVKK